MQSKGVYAELALWTALDLPQNTPALAPKQMKAYIAPVCALFRSYADTNDTVGIALDNIYFDILELCARKARVKLGKLPDSLMAIADLSKAFRQIVREMHEDRLRMNRKFHREMFRDENPKALETWQKMLSEELSKTAKWCTQPVECYRFLQNTPLEKDYSENLGSNALLLGTTEQVLPRDTWHAEFCQVSRFRK